jgi:hypothetical protein
MFSQIVQVVVVVCVDWVRHISELQPPVGLLFMPQMIYEYGEQWWNDTDMGKPKNSVKNLSRCHFVHQKSHTD